jgi:WD40 repeat protein
MAYSADGSTIVLGSQDGNVWVLNKDGLVQWKYPVGSWVNGVGVSRDGSVIAATALDGTIYALDKDGHLLGKTKTDSFIQQRSVAISGDGKRIVVVDQLALYGIDLVGIPEVTTSETPVQTLQYTTSTSTSVPFTTTVQKTVRSTTATTIPGTTGTQKSALTPAITIAALAALYIVIRRKI